MGPAFTGLEAAALRAIFGETPDLAPALNRQFEVAHVTERENTGGGFYTSIAVPDHAPPVTSPSVLGWATHADIAGLEHGFGFALFMENGRLHMLEGFAWGPGSTRDLDLATIGFEIYDQAPGTIRPIPAADHQARP